MSTAPEGGIVRLCLRQFVGGHDREVRLEPRGHLLVHQAAGRDETAACELLELRQGEFLPVLGLVDPRYAHAAQGQHVRGRRRTVLRLLLLEEHFNLHVAGQRHAEDVRHQLDQGILAVSPMLAPKNDEHMLLAVADQAVAEEPPDEIDKPLVAVHAPEQKSVRLRAGVFKLQHVRRVLGQAGIQQVILRATVPQFPRAKINNAVRTRQGVILLVDEVRHDQQGLACPPRHDQQIILSCLASEPIHPTVSLVGYALYLFPQVLFFIGKRIGLPLLFVSGLQVIFTHILNRLVGFIPVILTPVVSIPDEEALPMLDVNDQTTVQSVVELGVTDAVLLQVCDQLIHGDVGGLHPYGMVERLAERPILLYLCKHSSL